MGAGFKIRFANIKIYCTHLKYISIHIRGTKCEAELGCTLGKKALKEAFIEKHFKSLCN